MRGAEGRGRGLQDDSGGEGEYAVLRSFLIGSWIRRGVFAGVLKIDNNLNFCSPVAGDSLSPSRRPFVVVITDRRTSHPPGRKTRHG